MAVELIASGRRIGWARDNAAHRAARRRLDVALIVVVTLARRAEFGHLSAFTRCCRYRATEE